MSMWLDGPVFTRSRTRYDRVVRCRDAAAEAAEYWAECLEVERRLRARRLRKARLAAGVFLMVSPRRAQNARAEAAAARCARVRDAAKADRARVLLEAPRVHPHPAVGVLLLLPRAPLLPGHAIAGDRLFNPRRARVGNPPPRGEAPSLASPRQRLAPQASLALACSCSWRATARGSHGCIDRPRPRAARLRHDAPRRAARSAGRRVEAARSEE